MNHIKLIKTHKDHEAALARLMHLMDLNPAPNSKEFDEIDVLGVLIERYEEEAFPMDQPDPIEAIKFRMDQQGLKQKDLVPYIGSASKVSEVLNRSRSLSLKMIRNLSDGLGISADVLVRDNPMKAVEDELNADAFPLKEMHKKGYFRSFTGSLSELKEYADEQIAGFLSSISSGYSLKPAFLRTTAHLRTNDKKVDEYALWAWLVRVLQQANEERLASEFTKGSVTKEWMRTLAKYSAMNDGPFLAQEYLNNSGIHLILEPHLQKTYLDGAVCTSDAGNPVIALTLRNDRLDNFWFTLMHELAHLALHVDGDKQWFLDNLDSAVTDQLENEADERARDSLIPKEVWRKFKRHDPDSVRKLAKQIQISPCIIAGRLRYEHGEHRLFGKLFRDKVRHHFS